MKFISKKVKMVNKETMLKKFEIVSQYFEKKNLNYHIYLFGSGLGMYHLENNYRMSNDTDYQSDMDLNDDEIKELFQDMAINEIGGIMDVPPLDEIEIVETLDYGNFVVYIPSIENFALSKLLSNRRKDLEDLENYPILDNCNILKLKEMLVDYLQYFVFKDNPSYNFNYLDDILVQRNLSDK